MDVTAANLKLCRHSSAPYLQFVSLNNNLYNSHPREEPKMRFNLGVVKL